MYSIETKSNAASVTCSIPFPLGGQTPLAIRADTVPPEFVESLTIEQDRENRPLRVTLKSTARGLVKVEVQTLALLRDRRFPDLRAVSFTPETKFPPDVRQHLKSAPGIDPTDKAVKAAAAKLSTTSVGQTLGDLTAWLQKSLTYEGGQPQGAKECLQSGKAVCTGYANTAASLLIARGLPARVLACVPLSGKTQEHYIIEAWAGEATGWTRVESTMGAYPWGDAGNFVVRIIYPDAPRSPFNVPLFVKTEGGTGGFDGAPGDGCWQEGTLAGQARLSPAALSAVESAAHKGFEALVKKRQKSAQIRFLPPGTSKATGGASADATEAAITKFLTP